MPWCNWIIRVLYHSMHIRLCVSRNWGESRKKNYSVRQNVRINSLSHLTCRWIILPFLLRTHAYTLHSRYIHIHTYMHTHTHTHLSMYVMRVYRSAHAEMREKGMKMMYENGRVKEFDKAGFSANIASSSHWRWNDFLKWLYIKLCHVTDAHTHGTGLKPINKNDGKMTNWQRI